MLTEWHNFQFYKTNSGMLQPPHSMKYIICLSLNPLCKENAISYFQTITIPVSWRWALKIRYLWSM